MRPSDLLLATLLAVTLIPSLHAQRPAPKQGDHLLGSWSLDVNKSRYSPGPGPLSETRLYKRGPNGVEGTILRRFPNGSSDRIEYIAEFDREYPVTGTEEYDHILLKQIDELTAESVLSHAGRVYGTARRALSRDGRTMTITFRRENIAGELVHNVAFYNKVDP
jgi:hypothetical protein